MPEYKVCISSDDASLLTTQKIFRCSAASLSQMQTSCAECIGRQHDEILLEYFDEDFKAYADLDNASFKELKLKALIKVRRAPPPPKIATGRDAAAVKMVERMSKGEASLWEVGKCALTLGAQETIAVTGLVGLSPQVLKERQAQLLAFYVEHDPDKANEEHVKHLLENYKFRDIVHSLEAKFEELPVGWELHLARERSKSTANSSESSLRAAPKPASLGQQSSGRSIPSSSSSSTAISGSPTTSNSAGGDSTTSTTSPTSTTSTSTSSSWARALAQVTSPLQTPRKQTKQQTASEIPHTSSAATSVQQHQQQQSPSVTGEARGVIESGVIKSGVMNSGAAATPTTSAGGAAHVGDRGDAAASSGASEEGMTGGTSSSTRGEAAGEAAASPGRTIWKGMTESFGGGGQQVMYWSVTSCDICQVMVAHRG
jgi:hypothetical protein